MSHSRRSHRRRSLTTIAAITAVTAVAALSACSTTEAAPVESAPIGEQTLKVGASGPAVEAIWEASGVLDDLPYDIEWVVNAEFGEAAGIFSAFESGAIDIAWNGAIPVSTGIVGDVPFTILSVAEALPDPEITGGELITPVDSDIKTLEDLKGKTVVVAKNSGTQYFLDDFLEQANVSLDEVNFQFVDPWDAVAAFSSGEVDAWFAYGAYTGQFLDSGDARIVIDGNGNDGDGNPTGFTKTKNFLFFWFARNESLEQPALAPVFEDFIGRTSEVNAWANAHQKELEQVIVDTLDIDAVSAANYGKLFRNKQHEIDAESIQHLQDIADASTRYGILPETIDVTPYFDDRFNSTLVLE